MTAGSRSSGDLLADRRFAWARAMMAEDDHAAAVELLDQVIERVPGWAAAWAALAEARERDGRRAEARLAWERVGTLDPDGTFGAALNVARLEGRTPARMPDAYVRALFDDYAPRFDRHLVDGLHYRGPDVLAAALTRAAPERIFGRALDLGCGTGLMGRALAGRVGRLDGLDLSPAMVAQARRTGLYADLTVGSIQDVLSGTPPAAYDLVTALDVLVYCGDLAPIFAGVAQALEPDGLLAFTAQSATSTGAEGYELGPDLRFAHGEGYLRRSLKDAGFDLLDLAFVSLRCERNVPVPGLAALARRA